MNKVLEFLKKTPAFFLATTDGTIPNVRPFGFVMDFEGRLYFCTSNQKNVYKQLKANPNLEICGCTADSEWIRIRGKAVFDSNMAAKRRVMELSPDVAGIYQSPENPIFEVFYIENGEATFCSFGTNPEIVKF